MPVEVLQIVERVDSVKLPDGSQINVPTGDQDYEIIKASLRNDPSVVYIRRQHESGDSYLWTAPVDDWGEAVEVSDERWVKE